MVGIIRTGISLGEHLVDESDLVRFNRLLLRSKRPWRESGIHTRLWGGYSIGDYLSSAIRKATSKNELQPEEYGEITHALLMQDTLLRPRKDVPLEVIKHVLNEFQRRAPEIMVYGCDCGSFTFALQAALEEMKENDVYLLAGATQIRTWETGNPRRIGYHGDGAGVLILGSSPYERFIDLETCIIEDSSSIFYTKPANQFDFYMPQFHGKGNNLLIDIDGRSALINGVRGLEHVTKILLERQNISPKDITAVIAPSYDARLLKYLGKKFGLEYDMGPQIEDLSREGDLASIDPIVKLHRHLQYYRDLAYITNQPVRILIMTVGAKTTMDNPNMNVGVSLYQIDPS